jgi:hypothetical protein
LDVEELLLIVGDLIEQSRREGSSPPINDEGAVKQEAGKKFRHPELFNFFLPDHAL